MVQPPAAGAARTSSRRSLLASRELFTELPKMTLHTSQRWPTRTWTRAPPSASWATYLDVVTVSLGPRHPCATGQRKASSWPARAQTTYLCVIAIWIVNRHAYAARAVGSGESSRPWPSPLCVRNSVATARPRLRMHDAISPPRSACKHLAAAHPTELVAPQRN